MLITKIFRDYSNFSSNSNRLEYGIYQIINLIVIIIVFDFSSRINFKTNDVMYLFYVWIVVLITFVPLQSVTVRRLNDLKHNRTLIVFNFVPFINIIFKIYLLIMIGKMGNDRNKKKNYKNSISDIHAIGKS